MNIAKLIDPKLLKLGKKSPKLDARTLQFAKYVQPTLPAPPDSIHWTQGQTEFGTMLNTQLGDCTVAAAPGHAVQVWSLNVAGFPEQTISDNSILNCYEQWAGYNPSDPNTDQGAFIIDILNHWRKQPVETHRLLAYAQVNPVNLERVKQAIALFGTVDIGVALPLTAQDQIGSIWTVVGDPSSNPNAQPGSWGGHSVIICGYTPDYLECITWGAIQKIGYDFWNVYVDEAYALLGGWWITHHTTPSGFDHQQLNEDLAQVAA